MLLPDGDLWFATGPGPASREGLTLYTIDGGPVRAVHAMERDPAESLESESAQVLGQYGADVHGMARALREAGAELPAELDQWGLAPDRPMARFGGWKAELMEIDGSAQLALGRDVGALHLVATTWGNIHVAALAEASAFPVVLRTRARLPRS